MVAKEIGCTINKKGENIEIRLRKLRLGENANSKKK